MPWRSMREKKPLEVIASNPGQLLFTRIINRERARTVTNRLMRDDMFNGWGWRTMSQDETRLQPAQLSSRLGLAAR